MIFPLFFCSSMTSLQASSLLNLTHLLVYLYISHLCACLFTVHYQKNGGKCGVCGDNYKDKEPRPHEAGGMYGNGIVSKRYIAGQVRSEDNDTYVIITCGCVVFIVISDGFNCVLGIKMADVSSVISYNFSTPIIIL